MQGMTHLTIRNVPPDLAAALEARRRERGASLNGTVLHLLAHALGVGVRQHDNGLGRYAGSWSASEADAFDRAVASFAKLDAEIWR